MIIGITGTDSVGKAEIAAFLIDQGFTYFNHADVVREELKNENLMLTPDNVLKIENDCRIEHGVGFWADKIIEKIDQNKNIIIDGINNVAEIEKFRELPNFYLIGIYTPEDVKYERELAKEKLESDQSISSKAKFELSKCMRLIDFSIIDEGEVDEIRTKTKEILDSIKKAK